MSFVYLPVFGGAFWRVPQNGLCDRVAVIFFERILGQETSERKWDIGKAILRGTKISLSQNIPVYQHVTQGWHVAAV